MRIRKVQRAYKTRQGFDKRAYNLGSRGLPWQWEALGPAKGFLITWWEAY